MLVRILKRTFGGVEYSPEQQVLKLGGKNSAGVEQLEFELPEEWENLAVTVHVQHLDNSLPEPVLLDDSRCLTVDRLFTASEKGLWMLKAVGEDGYCALTKPARYECYDTLSTDGTAEIAPSQYESFVSQVLGAANDTRERAKEAAASAENAQAAADNAEGSAARAEAAAKKMDTYEPYTLPAATASTRGGVKIGSGLTVDADGTLRLTEANINTALGYSLADKLKRLERMMNMDGKLVYTGTGIAGRNAVTLTVPSSVDYLVVRMMDPGISLHATGGSSDVGVAAAAAADYGSTRIVRGGSAIAMVGGAPYSFRSGVACTGAAPVSVSFSTSGTVSVSIANDTVNGDTYSYPFNVEGYQYL